jgi:hypothetical protein
MGILAGQTKSCPLSAMTGPDWVVQKNSDRHGRYLSNQCGSFTDSCIDHATVKNLPLLGGL